MSGRRSGLAARLNFLLFTLNRLTIAADIVHVAPSAPDQSFSARPQAIGLCANPQNLKSAPFVFDFMGKAERASWDLGVIKAAFATSPTLQSGTAIYAGNSSGAMLAGYFACWGVSKESLQRAEAIMNNFDYESLNLNTGSKVKRLFLGRVFGATIRLEEDHVEIGKLIDSLMIKDGKPCVPSKGIMISATNLDVLDSRIYDAGMEPKVPIWAKDQSAADPEAVPPLPRIKFSKDDKTVDWENFNVSKEGKDIGKACTYFVTPDILEKLKTLDRSKRQCELRRIDNLADLKLAIHASIAEPTFFNPVVDVEPDKILGGIIQPGTRRVYNGGYLVSPLGKDLKQVDPNAFVLGTGVNPFPDRVDTLLKNWFTMSPNQSLQLQKKALDIEIGGDWSWETEVPLPADLEKAGYEKARRVLETLQGECKLP